MSRLLFLAAIGVVLTAAFRLMRREMSRVGDTLAEVRVPSRTGDASRLVRGPDGVYRPADRVS